jgi:2,4-dienoyl-CoA reductase-like NADH-dependent reductase (Old Yellow Enzyme family)
LRFGIEAASSAEEMVPSRANIRREGDEAYLFRLSGYVKGNSSINITTVSVIRWQLVISRILSERLADYVALCRPLIRVLSDQPLEQRDLEKAKLISCNGCCETGLEGFCISCKVERKIREMAASVRKQRRHER